MNKIRTETWCGHDIRFVEINGEWWAILKDICDALNLHTFKISQRLDPSMLERVAVETESSVPSKYDSKDNIPSKYNNNYSNDSKAERSNFTKTVYMLAVNELGIYEALFASRKLEARKFRMWAGTVMQKLRKNVGLEGYEVMRMTEPDIQKEIDWILDSLYWDEEKGCVMQSITVAGGDTDQIPFE